VRNNGTPQLKFSQDITVFSQVKAQRRFRSASRRTKLRKSQTLRQRSACVMSPLSPGFNSYSLRVLKKSAILQIKHRYPERLTLNQRMQKQGRDGNWQHYVGQPLTQLEASFQGENAITMQYLSGESPKNVPKIA